MTLPQTPKIITIVGPTASGKSGLAVVLAQEINGEVISADSRQVYRGLDIGSAKITLSEMHGVPHHLLDCADPRTDTFTAADFVQHATSAIRGIEARGTVPIITGGTFFYIDALVGTTSVAPVPPNPILRTHLETLPTEALVAMIQAHDPRRAHTIDTHNRRRLIRSLEIIDALGTVPEHTASQEHYQRHTIGIHIDRNTLRQQITTRLDTRLHTGLCEEITTLRTSGVSDSTLIQFGLEYRYITEYLQGIIDLPTAREHIITKSMQFAKRQMTWLKRDQKIQWYEYPVSVTTITPPVRDFLQMK